MSLDLDQDQVGSSCPNLTDSPLSLCLAKLSADRLTSNLSRSFVVVNTPPFDIATNKDTLQHNPLLAAINPFFPPITLSASVHKRQRSRNTAGTIDATTPTRALSTQNDDINGEIQGLAGMTVLKTRLSYETHFLQ